MKKIIKYLPWALLAISIIFIGLLTIGLSQMKKDAVQQIKTIQVMEEKFKATQTTYDDQVQTLKDDLDKLQAEREVYAEQFQAAEANLNCPNRDLFKPDYSNDTGMTKALSDYLTTIEGGVIKSAIWEPMWGGTRSALFSINLTQKLGEVGYKFFVYHNDAYFKKNRVFYISKQCWLDG